MNPELGQKAALLIAFVSTSYKHVSAATAQLDFLFCWISKHVVLFGLFWCLYCVGHLMSCCFPIGCSVIAHRGRSALWDVLIKSLTLSWFFTHYISTDLSWFQILTVYIQLKGFDNRSICWSHDTCQNPLSSPKCDLSLLYYLNCISFGKSFVNICCRIICSTRVIKVLNLGLIFISPWW